MGRLQGAANLLLSTEYLQTFNFEYDLGPRVMLFNEFVVFAQVGGVGVPQQAYSHGGLHWFLLPNLQVDVHAAVGLNEAAGRFLRGLRALVAVVRATRRGPP
jgi:hypothetical protein